MWVSLGKAASQILNSSWHAPWAINRALGLRQSRETASGRLSYGVVDAYVWYCWHIQTIRSF
ncbi:MAG: hypothetical protein SV775_18105, partial [Thermodesulfobacteriota bacterium]|nr:hypothetical protein [Thermodesulfobacteriota bacterium]